MALVRGSTARYTIPFTKLKVKRRKQTGAGAQDILETESPKDSVISESNDFSDSNSDSEPTMSPESLKLFRLILQNAELGLQRLSKRSLIHLIEDSDPSDTMDVESDDDEEYKSSD